MINAVEVAVRKNRRIDQRPIGHDHALDPPLLDRIDYVGFTVPDVFLVGYGMDLDQKWRELPEIYVLKASPEE